MLMRLMTADSSTGLLGVFASGHLAKSLMWSFSDLLFSYFAHVHMGLSASDTGWILFISLAYSGALDVLAAGALSAFPGHEGRVPRLQFIGAVVTAFSAALLFLPLKIGGDWLFIWLLATSLLFRTGYGLYDVSQNALVSLLPRGEAEARRYVTTRTTLSYVAKVIVAFASFLVIGTGERQGAALATIVPIALMTVITAWLMSRHRIGTDAGGVPPQGSSPPIGLLLPVLIAVAAQICLLGLVGRFLPFARDPATGLTIGAPLVLASVLGGVFGPMLVDRVLGARGRFGLANPGFTLICAASALLMLFGPSAVLLIAGATALSIGSGAIGVLVWGEVSAAVRAHGEATGRRSDLASFALLTATVKLGSGVTGLFLGQLLDGYEARSPHALGAIAGATVLGGAISILAMAVGRRRRARIG
jgi:Na+/melibiose symporter-like transporter